MIGLILTAAGFFGAVLNLIVGVTSDRFRRKPFLISYEITTLFCSLAALLTSNIPILVIATLLAGFGRGASGAAGPFSSAEQAFLAEQVNPRKRGLVYSLNTAVGFFGMSLGALMAILPAVWSRLLPGSLSYRPLFLIVTFASIANLIVLNGAQENYQRVILPLNTEEHQQAMKIQRQENQTLKKLIFTNVFNGIAIGLTGPLISYWFALRFHIGPASIAPVMAATFFVTGISSLITGRLTQKIGIVNSFVLTRIVGLFLLVLLPLMPVYWLAALIYLVRSAFNRGSAGARQALVIGMVRDERRGLATSLNSVSSQIPRAAGPSITGVLLDAGQFTLPFFFAAFLQGIYLVFYQYFFRQFDIQNETRDKKDTIDNPSR
jgi:MFS family permease